MFLTSIFKEMFTDIVVACQYSHVLDNVNISSQRLCYECLSVLIILKGPLDTNTYLGIGTAEKYKILALI